MPHAPKTEPEYLAGTKNCNTTSTKDKQNARLYAHHHHDIMYLVRKRETASSSSAKKKEEELLSFLVKEQNKTRLVIG